MELDCADYGNRQFETVSSSKLVYALVAEPSAVFWWSYYSKTVSLKILRAFESKLRSELYMTSSEISWKKKITKIFECGRSERSAISG